MTPGILERGVILALRGAMQQAINLRPVRLYPGVPTPIAGLTPERCDLVIVRELVGGLYFGERGVREDGTVYDTCEYHPSQVERIARRDPAHDAVPVEQHRPRLRSCHADPPEVVAAILGGAVTRTAPHPTRR